MQILKYQAHGEWALYYRMGDKYCITVYDNGAVQHNKPHELEQGRLEGFKNCFDEEIKEYYNRIELLEL